MSDILGVVRQCLLVMVLTQFGSTSTFLISG